MDEQVPGAERAARNSCIRSVLAVFPDVCVQHVMTIMRDLGCGPNVDVIINHLVDEQEAGRPYPRQGAKDHKRKRTADEDDAEEDDFVKRTYLHPDRSQQGLGQHHVDQVHKLISEDFPQVPAISIVAAIARSRDLLFPAYVAVYEMVHQEDKNKPHVPAGPNAPDTVDQRIQASTNPAERELLMELRAARRRVALMERERRTKLEAERADEANFTEHQAKGDVKECECCFMEFAINRLVHCNGETAHWFCYECAYNQAKEQSGRAKYELTCMSTDGCDAGFSHSERVKFLDEKLTQALDDIEQEAVLRLTDLEGLEHCPFCPFAALCVPVAEDKEFRCLRPGCEKVSCRICREETHIPMSCEEARVKRQTFSAKHTVEEARSSALIRKCNKCGAPFIKEFGCNKMRCPRPGCNNMQCYVCSENCNDYGHFNDTSRGGKKENCPLFDDSETRHSVDADQAEHEALKRLAETNPELNSELLRFHMSDEVSRDDEAKRRRLEKERLNRPPPAGLVGAVAAAPGLAHQLMRRAPPQPERPVDPLEQARARARLVAQRIQRENEERNVREAQRAVEAARQPPRLLPYWLRHIPRHHREAALRSWTRRLPFMGGAANAVRAPNRAPNVPPPQPDRQPRRVGAVEAARQAVQELFDGEARDDDGVGAVQGLPAANHAAQFQPAANRAAQFQPAANGAVPQMQREMAVPGFNRAGGDRLQQGQRGHGRIAEDQAAQRAAEARRAAETQAQAYRQRLAGAQAQQIAGPVVRAAAGNVAPGAPEILRFPRPADEEDWQRVYRQGLLPRQQFPPAPGYTGRNPMLNGYGIRHLPPWRMISGYVQDPATGVRVPQYAPGAILYGNGGVWYGEPGNMRQISRDSDQDV